MKYRAMNVFIYDFASDSVGCLGRTNQSRIKDEPMGPLKLCRLVMRSLSTFSVTSTKIFRRPTRRERMGWKNQNDRNPIPSICGGR